MLRYFSYILFFFLLTFLFSFTLTDKREKETFSKKERRSVHVSTSGLFVDSDYFTVSSENLSRDGWCFPVPGGIVFKPDFEHDAFVWYVVSAKKKATVVAAMSGVVRLARKTSLGKTIVIRHSNGLETVYANHAENKVSVGEYVEAGQMIALAGAAHGMVYTYFAVMANGVRFSPDVFSFPDGKLKEVLLVCQWRQSGLKITLGHKGDVSERMVHLLNESSIVNLDRAFSELERTHVGVATPGLFEHSSSFTLDLRKVGRWSYPLPGARVISPYGGSRKNHTGTDLKTVPKDKVRAVFDGVVRFSGVYSAYGNMVVVRHSNGLETCYAHNMKNLVKVGDRVKAGDVIARVGRTGRATTEHCHFEVRVNGVPFNSDYLFDHSRNMLKTCKLTFTRKKDGNVSVNVH